LRNHQRVFDWGTTRIAWASDECSLMLLYEVSFRLLFNNSGFEGGVFAWLFCTWRPWQAIAWDVRYSVRSW